ncbi:MAG: VWA domain-containing protein [Aureliella sp.]
MVADDKSQDNPNVSGEAGGEGVSEAQRLTTVWDAMLPHSLSRLANRLSDLESPYPYRASGVTQQVASSSKSRAKARKGNREATSTESLSASSSAGVGGDKQQERLSQLASQFKAAEEDDVAQPKRFLLAGMSGVVASAVLHVVLIAVLAVVTLKLPGPPAGLAFESSAVSEVEDVVEMTQPLEAQSLDASEEADAETFENQIEITDQLSSNVTAEPLLNSVGSVAAPVNRMASAMSATSSMVKSTSNASFFGAAAGGNCFCYVIDASGSMRGGPWEAARRELLKSLASLKPTQRFYIVMFTRSIEAIPQPGEREPAEHALYATPENLEHARRWLQGVQIGGSGAAPKACIEFAIGKEPDAIYLLTDGVTKVKDVASFIRQKNRISDLILGEQVRVPIHTIAFYSDRGQQLLRRIAAENKGQFIYVPDPTK